MRISSLLCLFFAICSPVLLIAQQTIQIGENKTAKNTFIVTTIQKTGNPPSKRMFLANKKAETIVAEHRSVDQTLQEPHGLRYSKKGALHLVFKNVLGDERIGELSGENLLVTMLYDKVGKVIAVLFMINKDTQLTLEEIEHLSFSIENDITFSFNPVSIDQNKRLVPFNHMIHFNKLLHQLSKF